MKEKVSVVFRIVGVPEEELVMLYPSSLIVGKTDEKCTNMVDKNTGEIYLNTDLALPLTLDEGVNVFMELKELKEMTKTNQTHIALQRFWQAIIKKVYFYDVTDENFCIQGYTPQEFFENFGFEANIFNEKPTKQLIVSLLKGEITVEEMFDALGWEEPTEEETKNEVSIVDYSQKPISEVEKLIKEKIVSQDEPIRRLLTVIYKNIIFNDPKTKSNVLLYGPTGVGKTETVKTLAKYFGLPVVIEDMTRYTENGYKGASTDDILKNLYMNAGENIELAQKSILVLDEIDKKASTGDGDKEISKADVLKNLLKIVEGGKFDIELDNYGHTINFDTSHLTVIAMGAFSNLLQPVKEVRSIGFNDTQVQKDTTKEINVEDFVKYGLPIEFIGRFKTIIKMNSLSLNDLEKILDESDLSVLKILKQKFKEKLNIDLNISEEMKEKIAKKAYDKKLGARALNNVVEELLEEILYEAFNHPKEISQIDVNESLFEDKKNFTMVKRKKEYEG